MSGRRCGKGCMGLTVLSESGPTSGDNLTYIFENLTWTLLGLPGGRVVVFCVGNGPGGGGTWWWSARWW